MPYQPKNTEFYDRSNRAKQSILSYEEKKPRKWCVKHPTAYFGEGYKQCVTGWKKGEECEEGK